MTALTRRSFVSGVAAIPFVVWFEKYAQAAGPFVRYDAHSAQGQAMLKIYAQVVQKMMTTQEGDPRSWVFQWYTHFVKGSTTKTAELARIYPSPSPWQALATEMWNTCQAHSGQPENYFLPWHRMFVYFFEQIIRNVGGTTAANFTLPYWNYTVSGANYAVIPPEFTKKGDPTYGSLYVDKRNTGVNSGNPIAPVGYLNLDSLKECIYQQNGAVQGFCLNIDSTLHGRVHVRTGNTMNMGAVPWAAGDPVFWAHHCQIDRLWASWNAAGRQNPTGDTTFMNKTFVFADGMGNRVVATIKDFLDISKLGYSYDKLEPVPACPTNKVSFQVSALKAAKIHAALKTPITLGAAPVHATMTAAPAAGAKAAAATSFAQRMTAVAPSHSVFVVIKGLKADVQPGVLYDVYLQLPEGTAPEKGADFRIGTLSFFDTGHGDHSVKGAGTQPKFVSFDVTDLMSKLAARKALDTSKLTLTFAPLGQPAANAKPVVGEVSIVEQ